MHYQGMWQLSYRKEIKSRQKVKGRLNSVPEVCRLKMSAAHK